VRTVVSLKWTWEFKAPLFIGDTVTGKITVADKRASKSQPNRGILTLDIALANQRGEVVQKGQNLLMVERQELSPA
jgi:acyl dehydratase